MVKGRYWASLKMFSLNGLSNACQAGSMGKRSTKSTANRLRRPRDLNQLAHQLVRESTERDETAPLKATPTEISRVMAALGRRGGKIGGKARASQLSPERRREIARDAARKRWSVAKPAQQ